MDPPPPAPPPRSPLRPPPPATSEPVLSKRQHALHELMSSERAYASDLALILEVHIPLALGPMTAEDIKIIFNNIAELAELSDVFCEALERTIGSALEDPDAIDDHIGELFLRYAPELETPYKQYITRHPSALAHLTALPSTPELTAYHTKTRDLAASLSHAWDLSSLLIKPVQRLLKYSLLLTAIIDATAESHPDRPHLVSAKSAMEDVARAVNEGRRRAEVVKEVLSAPKKPPTVLRIKSFRAPADVNSEAARVDRMAAELARIDVFAQQLSRTAQEWARAADTSARALLSWAKSFAAAIGLSLTVRSEAFDAFLSTLNSSILPRSSALLPQIASDLLAPLARLLASAAQPRQLLASMAEHAPLHHHLLTMPVSPKNRPPPALLSASAHYLALRVQLAAELPAYLSLLHRGLAALVRRLAAVQAAFFRDARDAWAELWDMLRVEGERNGGGAETEAVWRARWGDVDLGMQTLAVCTPLPPSLSSSLALSGKAAAVSNVLAALDPPRRGAPVNVGATTAMLGALQPAHAHAPAPSMSGSSTAEKQRKKEEKKKEKGGSSNATSGDPSPRSSLASSRLALLEGAGYGFREKPKSTKPKSKSKSDDSDPSKGIARRASDLTNATSNSNSNSNSNRNSNASRAPSRPPSRGRSIMDDQAQHFQGHGSFASPRPAPPPPFATSPRTHSRPPSPSPTADVEDFKARRSTWLAAPAQYTCRVVHPCTPPSAVSYFGFPFFALEEHALLGVLHEAGHPSTHPRLPLYVDDGEDCLLLCRDAAGEIGWALASFLAPLAVD
ncbi:hypothetical protein B0H13DRAFT_2178183 [Mycena leptocephala]|nr:hypothetical protein B0H13DRAFT_2178183 [Mycena leptocephala]